MGESEQQFEENPVVVVVGAVVLSILLVTAILFAPD